MTDTNQIKRVALVFDSNRGIWLGIALEPAAQTCGLKLAARHRLATPKRIGIEQGTLAWT